MDDAASYGSHASYGTSSSSSSSDDDFLASTPAGMGGGLGSAATQQDREALVRKKLLESFYGAAASPAGPADDEGNEEGEDNGEEGGLERQASSVEEAMGGSSHAAALASSSFHDNDEDPTSTNTNNNKVLSPRRIPLPFTATKSDLDSPSFDPTSHVTSHIAHSSVHTLLDTNERLALDIRTLDSTMQTLVYENYSKFIDATDAIRSIGAGVGGISAGKDGGLDRLVGGMDRIRDASERTENLLRESRDAVAEKLRIQRLLTRLDALLSLPQTLRSYISQGKYRTAVRSHLSATEILGRHSAGFESLRSIEGECGGILTELATDLKERLIDWSGGEGGGGIGGSYSTAMDASAAGPNSIAEIFECAGTLLMLYPTPFSPGLDRANCQSLALAACGRFLGGRLMAGGHSASAAAESPPAPPGRRAGSQLNEAKDEGSIDDVASDLPLSFLDGMLEATTLYGVSFEVSGHVQLPDARERALLAQFVGANFDKFIAHVRMFLIERSRTNSSSDGQGEEGEEEESKEDANFAQISLALSRLLRSVRELASGLALPEVGLDVELASGLVDKAVELSETLVRRRVATRFDKLRVQVVRECLAPLVRQVIESGNDGAEEEAKEGGEGAHQPLSLVEIIQLASVALSDGLQMADDLIRATLSHHSTDDAQQRVTAPVDSAVVKLAVQASARSFGAWLASALEQLAGCEPDGEDDILLEVWDEDEDGEEEGGEKKQSRRIVIPRLANEEGIESAKRWISMNSTSFSRAESAVESTQSSDLLIGLVVELDDGAADSMYSRFLLAVCEMCRLAERSMASTLDQSIRSAVEDDARAVVADSANTLFGETINPHRKGRDGLDSEGILSKRFQLAASRALAMYVLERGAAAASQLCAEMEPLADASDPYAIPSRPREACLNVFEIAKSICEDCISIVGGDLFVAPVPPFPEEMDYVDVFGERLVGGAGGGAGASSGLQLDVERMFIEKTQVYPHPSDQCDFTRNSVVSGALRVALSAFMERVRSSVLSSLGYRQVKVDAVFLRYVIPHFVKDEFGTPEANCCSSLCNVIDDIMLKAGQRCFDHEVTSDDDYYDVEKDEIFTPYQLVQRFIESGEEDVMKRVAFS